MRTSCHEVPASLLSVVCAPAMDNAEISMSKVVPALMQFALMVVLLPGEVSRVAHGDLLSDTPAVRCSQAGRRFERRSRTTVR
jgi:hypothetical protein